MVEVKLLADLKPFHLKIGGKTNLIAYDFFTICLRSF